MKKWLLIASRVCILIPSRICILIHHQYAIIRPAVTAVSQHASEIPSINASCRSSALDNARAFLARHAGDPFKTSTLTRPSAMAAKVAHEIPQRGVFHPRQEFAQSSLQQTALFAVFRIAPPGSV
jgi:hypothetical protein